MINHIGYTSEKFRITDNTIYKYSEDPERKDFLLSQMNHLLSISRVLPENVPGNIQWLESETEWGYQMEYIQDATRLTNYHLDKVVNCLSACSRINAATFIPDFNTFYNYIVTVIQKNKKVYQAPEYKILLDSYLKELEKNEEFFNQEKSSSHGDFTIENMLVSGDRIILIDCIKKDNLWTSWILDAAKFYQNIYFRDTTMTFTFSQKLLNANLANYRINRLIFLLMITNYIRMFPYIKDKKEIFKERYEEFQILINNL